MNENRISQSNFVLIDTSSASNKSFVLTINQLITLFACNGQHDTKRKVMPGDS